MADSLEFRIGGLKIVPYELAYHGSNPYKACHKFVVESANNAAVIYVAVGDSHPRISQKFNLNKDRLVGGGSCYIDKDGRLVLNDFSGNYGGIPKEAAQKFAELIVLELKKQGIKTSGINANPKETRIHLFWDALSS